MAVDAGYADWLKSDALYALATVAGVTAAFGDNVVDQQVISPVALAADAATEANRMRDFMAGPLVIDRALVKGLRSDLIGKLITLQNDRLGYAAGVVAFVIGVQEVDDSKTTQLSLLRRL